MTNDNVTNSKSQLLYRILLILILLLFPAGIRFYQDSRYKDFFFHGKSITIVTIDNQVFTLTDQDEVDRMAQILSDWDMRTASLKQKEKMDLACPIRISFENGPTLYLAEKQNYGRIEGDPHDYRFPEEFVSQIRDLCAVPF